MLRLVKPSKDLFDAFLAMSKDYRHAGESRYQRDAGWSQQAFIDYLQELTDYEQGIKLPPKKCAQMTYWLVDPDGQIAGVSRFRPVLTEDLSFEGGNVGYDVPPSKRRCGYGTELLRLTLKEAWVHGLHEVLLTCNKDNLGSRRIMEANGAVLVSEGISKKSGVPILRFLIRRHSLR